MDQQILSSRAVIGAYFARLEQNPGMAWVNAISNLFESDQALETYPFLGQVPRMREWIGGRQAKGLRGDAFEIRNKHYEATLEIAVRDMRRDKTGQLVARVNEFADSSQAHWASMLSALIATGAAAVCYDGQYFFDTDHVTGDSGSQSNSISVDISTLAAQVHGVVTDPSIEEMQQAILQGVVKVIGLKDDRGEPLNESASGFLVLTPPGLYMKALASVSSTSLTAIAQNLMTSMPGNMKIDVQMDARSTWTDKFSVWRTDSPLKALIRQNETEVDLKVKAEGSEFEFDNDAHQYGIDAWRNAGFGLWQRACLVTMT